MTNTIEKSDKSWYSYTMTEAEGGNISAASGRKIDGKGVIV
ncbi:hypothetical protein BRYFOR_08609 [Marvinbryantia formatexigens DSM 14469]|uniref:Uncharacterized protein n=1 Tax=Marvinbryantia formatexigens DSM 14469 TaxID=478749 RepID=C6LIX8_9FIRM|nr:hypothetical protein BRYFOR_08609 [Marvinbryantia formatexigens DSM 14469]